MASAIPVVDFGAWPTGSRDDRKRLAGELAGACRRVGFVYVVHHGVPDDLLAEAFAWSQKLFDLPREKKMLAPHPPGTALSLSLCAPCGRATLRRADVSSRA